MSRSRYWELSAGNDIGCAQLPWQRLERTLPALRLARLRRGQGGVEDEEAATTRKRRRRGSGDDEEAGRTRKQRWRCRVGILPDEAVEKTAIWYHVGLDDTAARVTVAQDAYAFLEDHAQNEDAVETSATDDFTGHHRTTWTLTKEGLEVVKYSEYEGMGHVTGPPYADPAVFDWLFGQSLACR